MRPRLGISGKLMLCLAVAAVAVVAVMGILHYHSGTSAIRRELDASLAAVSGRLALGLEHSVPESDTAVIRGTLLAEFSDENLAAVTVWSEPPGRPPELLAGIERTASGTRDIVREPDGAGWVSERVEIASPATPGDRERVPLGHATVYLDRTGAEKRLLTSVTRRVLETVLVVTLLGLLLSYVASRYVVAPLERIRQAMLDVQASEPSPEADRRASRPFPDVETGFRELREMGECFARSIESLRARESSLRESEEMARLLLNATHDSALLVDPAGWIVRAVNEASARRFGRSVEEIVGHGIRDLMPPAVAESRLAKCAEVVRSGRPISFEDERQGLHFDNSIHPVFGAQGEVVLVAVFAQDLTERKRAESSLRESESRFRSLFENAPDANLLLVDGVFIDCNQTALAMFRGTREELIGRGVAELSPELQPDGTPSAELGMAHVLEAMEKGHHRFEWVHRRLDGTDFWGEVIATAITLGGQQALFGTCRDITERKQAEAERRDLETQLRQSQKMEAIGQLAGGVAHDFNNLLTVILGNTEMSRDRVRHELGDNPGITEAMDEIELAAQRASSLTRQLLTFSRRGVTQPRILNVNRLLADLDRMLQRLVPEDIAFEVIAEPDLRSLRADPNQIEQVIVNLVVNAIHAMPDGGRLTLEAADVQLDEDYVGGHTGSRNGPHVMLAVSDTGHGMDEATRERIFEPFFTTKAVDRGTGLGLATVHGIVTRAGGHLLVESEVGRGTTLRVLLPAGQAGTSDEIPVPPATPAARGSETVLLCEDDRPVCVLIAASLRSAGYTVIATGTGVECLEKAGEHPGPIALLVTDVIMPDMNGRRLSERLRETRAELSTLFISGYSSNVIAHHGVLDPGVEFLEKPFTREDLLLKVRSVLDRSRSRT